MKQTKAPQHIVQQQLALDSYLKTLLDEVPEDVVELAASLEARVEPRIEVNIQQLPAIQVAEEVVFKPLVIVEPREIVQPKIQTKLQPLSVMPEWAQQEFQALFFKVEHLILATPLTELARTINIERKIGKIPGQPSWFLGLLDDQDSRIGVLDTGQLIFGKTRGSQRNLETHPFRRILVTQDKRWGLACDEILSIGKLKPEKVRWRTNRQKKPWLIGTVIEELTAIIDVQALVPHRKQQN